MKMTELIPLKVPIHLNVCCSPDDDNGVYSHLKEMICSYMLKPFHSNVRPNTDQFRHCLNLGHVCRAVDKRGYLMIIFHTSHQNHML